MILGLSFMTLMRDLARFNVSNCNVVTNNRVYLLSYNVGLFVVLQQHRLRVVVVVVVEYLYSASRSASNALIVPQRCEEMSL